MEPAPDETLRAVGEWFARADEDFNLATYAFGMPEQDRPYRLIAYHA